MRHGLTIASNLQKNLTDAFEGEWLFVDDASIGYTNSCLTESKRNAESDSPLVLFIKGIDLLTENGKLRITRMSCALMVPRLPLLQQRMS